MNLPFLQRRREPPLRPLERKLLDVLGDHLSPVHVVPNSPYRRGPMHNVTQHFEWTERIPGMRPCP